VGQKGKNPSQIRRNPLDDEEKNLLIAGRRLRKPVGACCLIVSAIAKKLMDTPRLLGPVSVGRTNLLRFDQRALLN